MKRTVDCPAERRVPSIRQLLQVSLLALLMINAHCSNPNGNGSVTHAMVRDFDGVSGYWLDYHISPESIRIIYGDDFGSPEKLIWENRISQVKAQELYRAIHNLPFEKLKTVYEDDSVDDGLQLTFKFRFRDGKTRTFEIRNRDQHDLQLFVSVLNKEVPEKYRIAEQWSIENSGKQGVRHGD